MMNTHLPLAHVNCATRSFIPQIPVKPYAKAKFIGPTGTLSPGPAASCPITLWTMHFGLALPTVWKSYLSPSE